MKLSNKISFAAALLAVVMFCSCSSSFLNDSPDGYLQADQLERASKLNAQITAAMVTGVYSNSFAFGSGGTEDHTDFGQKSVDIYMDILSGDMAMTAKTYGWFSDAEDLVGYSRNANRNSVIWTYYFQLIKTANEVVAACGGDEKLTGVEAVDWNLGQALASRAHSYLNLMVLYFDPYGPDTKNQKALPLFVGENLSQLAEIPTQEVIYARIIADLKLAIEAFDGFSRNNKSQIDKTVAQGILAYVYLQSGDYANAYAMAKAVIDSGVYPLLAMDKLTTTGFNNIYTSDNWMWGIDLTVDTTPALPSFWGQCDYFTYSYCAAGDYKVIDDLLYKEIPATDERIKWFRPEAPQMFWWKFYDNARVPMGNRTWDQDEVYMRIEEMYLIAAEAAVRNNDLSGAKAVLKSLLAERDADMEAKIDAMDQDQLLAQSYYNWRVELLAEGKGLQIFKRFKVVGKKRGNSHVSYKGVAVSYSDTPFKHVIPQAEANNNPFLQALEQ